MGGVLAATCSENVASGSFSDVDGPSLAWTEPNGLLAAALL
jgi:hypothetical protein